jgi:hypothetical protein
MALANFSIYGATLTAHLSKSGESIEIRTGEDAYLSMQVCEAENLIASLQAALAKYERFSELRAALAEAA